MFTNTHDFPLSLGSHSEGTLRPQDLLATGADLLDTLARHVNREPDMERMRAWCADEWHWCGVIVRPSGACKCCGPSESLWGIESDAGDYLREVACEIAEELAYAARAAA